MAVCGSATPSISGTSWFHEEQQYRGGNDEAFSLHPLQPVTQSQLTTPPTITTIANSPLSYELQKTWQQAACAAPSHLSICVQFAWYGPLRMVAAVTLPRHFCFPLPIYRRAATRTWLIGLDQSINKRKAGTATASGINRHRRTLPGHPSHYHHPLIFFHPQQLNTWSTCLDAEKVARAWARVVLSVIARFFVTTSKVRGLGGVWISLVLSERQCRYHKACHSSSCASWWCEAYFRSDLWRDTRCSQDLPWKCECPLSCWDCVFFAEQVF